MEVPTDITISVLNRGWAEMSEGNPTQLTRLVQTMEVFLPGFMFLTLI